MVEVAFDTASDLAGVALTAEGRLLSELTWRTARNHSRELLPALDWLLRRASLSKTDITGIAVCTGPGSYAGLRVGLSTAKALSYALGVPIAGIGRLAADAMPLAIEPGRRVVAVHTAGRAELAWGAYLRVEEGLQEAHAPRLGRADALVAQVSPGDTVCGVEDEGLRAAIAAAGAVCVPPTDTARVLAVATLGWRRLQAGEIDSTDALVPLYLREPAIGPQKPLP